MLCFPLDNTEYEAEGLGLEHVTRSRGVFAADDNLRVSAGGGMNVTISPGITSRTNSAPIVSSAQLSEASTYALSRFPIQSGLNP